MTPPRVFYLHGFASSPASTKASYFRERFRQHGIELECPDFNEPDFATLTLTRMLDRLASDMSAADTRPVTLIGSSLGGALAVLAAARAGGRIDRLVLLAPAVMFARPGHHLLPPERLGQWRASGALAFPHDASHSEKLLNVAFYDDSLQYDPFDAVFSQPTLIYQGTHDAAVDPRAVESFAATRPNVTLRLVEDDHQLMASLPHIWAGISRFLELA